MAHRMRIALKTSPQGVSWRALDEIWSVVGESDAFDGIWMNDHLTDFTVDRAGASLEAFTAAATLAHRVPGKWIGHAVLSNTFRHPAVLAKAATVLDIATGGRYILGLGAGWHEGEHEAFGIPLPPLRERIDRMESAVAVIRSLFSVDAAASPGVTRDDPFYPLVEATNEPGPVRPGGPPLYLGGQGPRGLSLAARSADGWLLPGVNAGDARYLGEKRDRLVAGLEAEGRDPGSFAIVGQVSVGPDRQLAVDQARGLIDGGATELILGMRAALGTTEAEAVAAEVLAPLRETLG